MSNESRLTDNAEHYLEEAERDAWNNYIKVKNNLTQWREDRANTRLVSAARVDHETKTDEGKEMITEKTRLFLTELKSVLERHAIRIDIDEYYCRFGVWGTDSYTTIDGEISVESIKELLHGTKTSEGEG